MGRRFQFLTCDMQDMRMKFTAEDPSEVTKSGSGGVDRSQGAARAISVRATNLCSLFSISQYSCQSFIDPGLKWADLDWFKSITKSVSNCQVNNFRSMLTNKMTSASDSEGGPTLGGSHLDTQLSSSLTLSNFRMLLRLTILAWLVSFSRIMVVAS